MELEGYAFSFDENLEVPYEREELIRLYWQMHPRFRFVKSCKDGNFLDIGSGSGGLFFWKEWEQPIRNGLHMFAVDMQAGEFVDRYEAFRMCNLEHRDFPYENGFFDHVFSAHVFEHLQQPVNLIKNISKILKGGVWFILNSRTITAYMLPGGTNFRMQESPVRQQRQIFMMIKHTESRIPQMKSYNCFLNIQAIGLKL